jgi:hypothetical protein
MALLIIDIQQDFSNVDPSSSDYKHTTSFRELVFTYLEAQTTDSRVVSFDYKLSGSLSNLPNPSIPAKFIDGIAPIAGEDICLPKKIVLGLSIYELGLHFAKFSH